MKINQIERLLEELFEIQSYIDTNDHIRISSELVKWLETNADILHEALAEYYELRKSIASLEFEYGGRNKPIPVENP